MGFETLNPIREGVSSHRFFVEGPQKKTVDGSEIPFPTTWDVSQAYMKKWNIYIYLPDQLYKTL